MPLSSGLSRAGRNTILYIEDNQAEIVVSVVSVVSILD